MFENNQCVPQEGETALSATGMRAGFASGVGQSEHAGKEGGVGYDRHSES